MSNYLHLQVKLPSTVFEVGVVDSLEKGNALVYDGIETNWGMLVDGL